MSPVAAIETRCGACGTAVPDHAHFCPGCGAELKGSLPPTPPTPPTPPAGPPTRRRRWWIWAAPIAALLAVGAAFALLSGGAAERKAGRNVSATTPTGPVAKTTTAAVLPVTRASVNTLLRDYAGAYSAGSVERLGALFAANFTRRNGTEAVQTKAEALKAYRKQFDEGAGTYRLTVMTVIPKATTAWALARYDITTAGGGKVSGLAQFDMVATDQGLRITRLRVAPYTGGTGGQAGSKTTTPSVQVNPPPPPPEENSVSYAQTCRVKAWYSTYSSYLPGTPTVNSTYMHFKCVDEKKGTTVEEALGSDHIDLRAEQQTARRTAKREELVAQLRNKLEAKGWKAIGAVSGGDWYQLRFGR